MKTATIMLVVLVSGVAALTVLGKFFIREVVQESALTTPLATAGTASVVDAAEPAPYFELLNLSGATVTSSDFRGMPAVVTFWTTWNPDAADQIQILDEFAREDTKGLFKIVAISGQEDRSVVANFVRRGGYEVEVLLDESGAVTEAYQARNLPTTYFMDEEGIVREVFIGILSESQLVEKVEMLLR